MPRKTVIAFIPARMHAARFPGKPLADIRGLPMVEHVRRRAGLCPAIDDVYVATCDPVIRDAVVRHGGKALMTASTHERCTDRIEEAARQVEVDIAVIVQGDEPLVTPDLLEALVRPLVQDDRLGCANGLSVIRDERDLHDVDIIKAAVDQQGFVMYFSRSPIPHMRAPGQPPVYRQTGLSAFTKTFLSRYAALPPTPLERAESIDFLRILEHRHAIFGVRYDQVTVGVDRPEDIAKIERILADDPLQRAYDRQIRTAARAAHTEGARVP